MNTKEVIRSQYQASLEMLAQAIFKCPQSLWADPQDKNQFWHIAYHALFYTHLYLQASEEEFPPSQGVKTITSSWVLYPGLHMMNPILLNLIARKRYWNTLNFAGGTSMIKLLF